MAIRFASTTLPVLALAASLLAAGAAHAADSIGSAITINNLVTAELDKDKRRLGTGDDVHQNELIEVGEDSLGELKFKDETKLALGAGSRVVLDKYVYDSSKTGGSIIMNLVKGTFRFITGIAAKPTYLIKTPHASISVRGTIFDVYVEDDGAAWLLLVEGSVKVCNARGRCRVLDEPGKLVRIDEDGTVHKPAPWKELPRKQRIRFDSVDEPFPFVRRPPEFAPAPDFTDEVVTLGIIPPPDVWISLPRWPHRPPQRGDGPWYPGGGKDPSGGKGPRGTGGGIELPGSTGKVPILRRGKDGKPILVKRGNGTKIYANRDRILKAHRLRMQAKEKGLRKVHTETSGRKARFERIGKHKSVTRKNSGVSRTHHAKTERTLSRRASSHRATTHKSMSHKQTSFRQKSFKPSGFKSSGFKPSGFKASGFKPSMGRSFGGFGGGGFRGRR